MIRRFRNRLPAAAAVLILLVVVLILGGRYISNEYHTYYSDKARDFETTSVPHGPWVLNTERKELLGKVYATFTVTSGDSGELIYRCPDLYLVPDLLSISWDEATGDILVETDDQGTVRYVFQNQTWENQNENKSPRRESTEAM